MSSGQLIERLGRDYGLGFRTNGKLCFFSHSLFWLVRYAGLVEVKIEMLDDGELVLYGEMSDKDLEDLIAAGTLREVQRHFWGINWPFGAQPRGTGDFSDYPAWRDGLLLDFVNSRNLAGKPRQ